MKYINSAFTSSFLVALSLILVISSCNKDVEQISEAAPVAPTGSALGETLSSNPDDSLYYRLIIVSGLLPTLNNKSTSYTMFVPNNNGMKLFINALSGGLVPLNAPDAVFSGFITANIPPASAAGLVSYNTCPQPLPFSSVPGTFPNFQYPTILNPAPTISALLRLTIFPSRANGQWVNNVPVTATDLVAYNGIIHHTATIVPPPQRFLWDRINTDTDLTIFKAAIQRADSGATAAGSLVGALSNIGANFSVLAPTNQAFKNAISFLTGGAIPVGAPDAVFIGFLGSPSITTELVKGIAVYHMFDDRRNTITPTLFVKRPGRFFSVNLPTTPTDYPTLLSSGDSLGVNGSPNRTFAKVTFQATFAGPGVSAATVKGAVNPTASNFVINPTPDPGGSSDQHYVNGTLHKIDQVLLPQ